MASQEGFRSRKIPSGPLSRLLPLNTDPLNNYGLPSKGENRLHDFKTQENYYTKIVERYVKFCADSGNSKELEKQFASMSLADAEVSNSGSNTVSGSNLLWDKPAKARKQQKTQSVESSRTISIPNSGDTSAESPDASQPSTELTTILHAMRKLRESIVATSRRDLFAQRAYLFIIRASILVRHRESYQSALNYLLAEIHPHTPLSSSELHEFVGYLILDLACRSGDFQTAYSIQLQHMFNDRKVTKIVNALVHDDWVTFWRLRRNVDGHQRALMEWAVERMRLHALKCLGKSYLSAEKSFIEASADMAWENLVSTCSVGWELNPENQKVTIRRPKTRQAC